MWLAIFRLCLSWTVPLLVSSVIPTGELTTRKIMGTTTVIYVAPGTFSAVLNPENEAMFMRLVKPVSGFDGCAPVAPSLRNNLGFYLLVSRGNCSFIDKAVAAKKIGALGVVVYNSLEGIYQGKDYASDIDYECDNGSGYIDMDGITSAVYDDAVNDLMPESCTKHSNCDSGRCVVTNTTHEVYGRQVCCAWDLYTTMGTSVVYDDDSSMPNIPAVFVRMQDAELLTSFDEINNYTLEVAMFARPASMFDFASILIWLIAVITVATGATFAAEEDKQQQQGLKGIKIGGLYRNYNLDPMGHHDRDSDSVVSHGGVVGRIAANTSSRQSSRDARDDNTTEGGGGSFFIAPFRNFFQNSVIASVIRV